MLLSDVTHVIVKKCICSPCHFHFTVRKLEITIRFRTLTFLKHYDTNACLYLTMKRGQALLTTVSPYGTFQFFLFLHNYLVCCCWVRCDSSDLLRTRFKRGWIFEDTSQTSHSVSSHFNCCFPLFKFSPRFCISCKTILFVVWKHDGYFAAFVLPCVSRSPSSPCLSSNRVDCVCTSISPTANFSSPLSISLSLCSSC